MTPFSQIFLISHHCRGLLPNYLQDHPNLFILVLQRSLSWAWQDFV